MGSTAEIPRSNHHYAKLVKGIYSSNLENAFDCTKLVRKLLSDKNPPIDDFIALKAVPRLVELLQHDELPDLELEAAWALTNIAAGSSAQTECVVNAGSLPHFIRLLGSPVPKIAEQAIWALSNIAGEGSHYRDMLIKMGIFPVIARLVTPDIFGSFLENVAWCLINLCRHNEPPMSLSAVRECLPIIRQLLCHDDRDTIINVCWCLTYISNGSDDRIQEVTINVDIIDRLITIIRSSNDSAVVKSIVDVLGNIATGTNEQTQVVIDHVGLAALKHVLQQPLLGCSKQVARALSNITAGSKYQIQAVINNGLLDYLITLLDSPNEGIRTEATCAICNLACLGTPEQSISIVGRDGFPSLIRMFSSTDPTIKQRVHDACRKTLRAAISMKENEPFGEVLRTIFGDLEQLSADNNEEVGEFASSLLQLYPESEDDDYVILPSIIHHFNQDVHWNLPHEV